MSGCTFEGCCPYTYPGSWKYIFVDPPNEFSAGLENLLQDKEMQTEDFQEEYKNLCLNVWSRQQSLEKRIDQCRTRLCLGCFTGFWFLTCAAAAATFLYPPSTPITFPVATAGITGMFGTVVSQTICKNNRNDQNIKEVWIHLDLLKNREANKNGKRTDLV